MFRHGLPRATGVVRSEGVPPWFFGLAAVAGATLAAYVALRLRRRRRQDSAVSELDALEEAAVERLNSDKVTGSCAIDVEVLAPGIVELTGVVPTQDVGQRAARLLHALPGVRTVINRLEAGSVEERVAAPRGQDGVAPREQPSRNTAQRAAETSGSARAHDEASAPETT